MRTIPKHKYLEAAQKFHWATKEHFILWMTGELKRHRRTETMLPRLVEKGKLVSKWYTDEIFGRRKVYTVPRRKNDDKFEHGLACTEGLVRCYLSEPSYVYPEHKFRGFGNVPEWGIQYKSKMVLYEHCTYSNFKHGEVKKKVQKYMDTLYDIEDEFRSLAIVIFVIDDTEQEVQNWVWRWMPMGEEYFFTDYENFLKIPIGMQYDAPIYIWGEDGKKYALRRKNA